LAPCPTELPFGHIFVCVCSWGRPFQKSAGAVFFFR